MAGWLSLSAAFACLVDLVVLGLIAECARVVLFELPTDNVRVARAVGKAPARIARLGLETTGLSRVAHATIGRAEGEDAPTAAREAVEDLRAYVTHRLASLRVMGPTASFAGLAGAAMQMSWYRSDHGLLDLDPDRVLRMAVEAGAVCMALGIAGSTAAIAALYFLRPRARAIQQAAERFAEQIAPAPAWTPASR